MTECPSPWAYAFAGVVWLSYLALVGFGMASLIVFLFWLWRVPPSDQPQATGDER